MYQQRLSINSDYKSIYYTNTCTHETTTCYGYKQKLPTSGSGKILFLIRAPAFPNFLSARGAKWGEYGNVFLKSVFVQVLNDMVSDIPNVDLTLSYFFHN